MKIGNYGITLVEILIVMAILGLLSFPLLITYQTSRAKQALRISTEVFADNLRTAHIFSREAKDEKSWGIKRDDRASYALVSKQTGDWQAEKVYKLENQVEFVGDFFVWFEIGTGETTSDLSLKLKNSKGHKLKVDILKKGTIEVHAID